MANTTFSVVPDSNRLDPQGCLPNYPVRSGLRGLYRAETTLDATRRNLAALFGYPKLAQITGSPVPAVDGVACQSLTNFLTTEVTESDTQTVCLVFSSSDLLDDATRRPMLYSNASANGLSLYLNGVGSGGAGTARLITNSYATVSGGSAVSGSTLLPNLPVGTPVFVVAIHTPTQVKLYAPALGLSATVFTRAAGAVRTKSTDTFRIGSSYAIFGGSSKILFAADYNRELSPAEYNLIRQTELDRHIMIGSGITF